MTEDGKAVDLMGVDILGIAAEIIRRLDALRSGRGMWEAHWQEVAQVAAPRKSDMLGARTDGDKRMTRVFDSTGAQANEILASGIYGMATNPATRWFGLRVLSEELMKLEVVKEYIAAVENRIFRALYSPGASIATHLHELFLDLSAFGTSVMFIGEVDGRPRFRTHHLRDSFVAEDMNGDIDTVMREFEMTARQMKQKWPKTIPHVVHEKIDSGKGEHKFKVIHGVFPREERNARSKNREDAPIASVYVMREGEVVLDEGGFDEFPFVVPRWYRNPGEVYGRSPAMTALPDMKMLQQMMQVHIRAGQKLVDPPLSVPDEGTFAPVRTMPGGINYVKPGQSITPLNSGGRLDISEQMMEGVRDRIRSSFFVDVIQFFQPGARQTATEVVQRTQERMRLLGPILGRMEAELLGGLITRVYGIMLRNGDLPETPEELADEPFTVEFVSPIATAQRIGEVEKFTRWLEINVQAMEIKPEVGDRINWEKIPEWTADRFRIDPELTLSDGEVRAVREAQRVQQLAALAGPAKDGAAALKTVTEAAGLPAAAAPVAAVAEAQRAA